MNDFKKIKVSGWRHERGYGDDGWRFTTVTRESPFRHRYFGVRRYTRADVYAEMAPDGGAGWYVYEIVNYNGPQHTVTLLGPFRKQGEAHKALYPYLVEQENANLVGG